RIGGKRARRRRRRAARAEGLRIEYASEKIFHAGQDEKRSVRFGQQRHCCLRLCEVQRIGEIVHVAAGVARRQRGKSPTPFDQFQHGGVVENERADLWI